MARRSKPRDAEEIRREIISLLTDFEAQLSRSDLREKVLALIPVRNLLNDLGSSLIPVAIASSARERILKYLQAYPLTDIDGQELAIVAGISEYARRVRELRQEHGWPIATGVTLAEMLEAGEAVPAQLSNLKPDHYVLSSIDQDKQAAYRWRVANDIRKRQDLGTRDKILEFFKQNVGDVVTNEELRYVAGDKTEWARRVRELRTEHGWQIITKNTGMPSLAIGAYLLQTLEQLPEHDRRIPDDVKASVFDRDKFRCVICGWTYAQRIPADPRQRLELHHKQHHAQKGTNDEPNLMTLCNVCHDKEHRNRG